MTPEELKAIEERAEKAKFSVINGEDFRSFIVALSPILDDDFPALCAALREAWARAEKAEATLYNAAAKSMKECPEVNTPKCLERLTCIDCMAADARAYFADKDKGGKDGD